MAVHSGGKNVRFSGDGRKGPNGGAAKVDKNGFSDENPAQAIQTRFLDPSADSPRRPRCERCKCWMRRGAEAEHQCLVNIKTILPALAWQATSLDVTSPLPAASGRRAKAREQAPGDSGARQIVAGGTSVKATDTGQGIRGQSIPDPLRERVPMMWGYWRVSMREQNQDLQIDALQKAGCEQIVGEKISSRKHVEERTVLHDLLTHKLRPGDTLVVWKLDRLGRGTVELIELMDWFSKNHVDFVGLNSPVDTTTAMGKFIFKMFAGIAEMERDIIRERTMAGLAAARLRGRIGGRPSSANPKMLAKARQLYVEQGRPATECWKILGVCKQTWYRQFQPRLVAPHPIDEYTVVPIEQVDDDDDAGLAS